MNARLEDAKASMIGRVERLQAISDELFRVERHTKDGRPFAVYYFTAPDDLDEWAKNLSKFQEDLIAPSYFGDPPDLRWNQYLMVLAPAGLEQIGEVRSKIERDVQFTRKRVL